MSTNNGQIVFSDGNYAQLPPGTYELEVQQTLTPAQPPPPPHPGDHRGLLSAAQTFVVRAPRFTIDPSIVQSFYPQSGAAGEYSQVLPHLVLDDDTLPWERHLTAHSKDRTPWLALMLFAASELVSRTTTMTVGKLLQPSSANTIGPDLDDVDDAVRATHCQVITIPVGTFTTLMPTLEDLALMAHAQQTSSAEENGRGSVFVANRLPNDASPNSAHYYAHLVSLEGFADYLLPDDSSGAKARKAFPTGVANVQLATLFNWSFTTLPDESPVDFAAIATLLRLNAGPLELTPDASDPDPEVVARYHDGYAPLTFVTGTGDETFAWYRGPFSAVPAQTLPDDPSTAPNADALTIYAEGDGLFDLSYAAAWNIGRGLALADSHFSQSFLRLLKATRRALGTLAQRRGMPHFAAIDDPRALLAPDASRRRFLTLMDEGLGRRWTERRAPAGAKRGRRRRAIDPRQLLADPRVAEAIREVVAEATTPVAAWLQTLAMLGPVPFSYLVPNNAMLKVDSIKFFYIDSGWIAALLGGATSIGIQSSADSAALDLLRSALLDSTSAPAAGLLLRSQLVSGWPTLVITAGGANTLRDQTLSSNVRLLLFDAVPDSVTLREPYHGMQIGVGDDNQVFPRSLGGDGNPPVGEPQGSGINIPFRSGTVIKLADLSSDLATPLGAKRLGPGELALQLVQPPNTQIFQPPNTQIFGNEG